MLALTLLLWADLMPLVFTGGIGENSVMVRNDVCSNMEFLGIKFDESANQNVKGECAISAADSKVNVLRIPTNEELGNCT